MTTTMKRNHSNTDSSLHQTLCFSIFDSQNDVSRNGELVGSFVVCIVDAFVNVSCECGAVVGVNWRGAGGECGAIDCCTDVECDVGNHVVARSAATSN